MRTTTATESNWNHKYVRKDAEKIKVSQGIVSKKLRFTSLLITQLKKSALKEQRLWGILIKLGHLLVWLVLN